MSKKNILVFPCGSEVALEIYRSLQYSIHFNLIGANSVDDHGKFVFENYIGGLPFANDTQSFIPEIKKIVQEYKIDAIYPAMDAVIDVLKQHEAELGCAVIAAPAATTAICLSKSKTYAMLKDIIVTPKVFPALDENCTYPVFLKPDIGYGSRGVKKALKKEEALSHLQNYPGSLILEYLPGKEYTIDCFTNFEGKLLYAGSRERKRIVNGISVNTSTMKSDARFQQIAESINQKLDFNGAWFFQVKERADGTLVLMEIAARMGGSSSVYRIKGVNFAMMSAFNAFKIPVSVLDNAYQVEMDRALDCKYKVNLKFQHVYIDFDDVVILNDKVNTDIVQLVFSFINQGKQIHLITKHERGIHESLKQYRLQNLFDEVIHLKKEDNKWRHIIEQDAIFIDDSFAERKEVKDNLGLAVFAPDMIKDIIFY